MGLQVVYFVLSIYGWYEWLYGGKGRTELQRVANDRAHGWACCRRSASSFWAVDRHVTSRLPGVVAAVPRRRDGDDQPRRAVHDDAQAARELDVWIVVDVVYVGMFIFKGLYLTAANYADLSRARGARPRRVETLAGRRAA